MLGEAPNQQQIDLFKAALKQIIDPKHPLVILAQAIPWVRLEEKFELNRLACTQTTTPSRPRRLSKQP